MYPFRPEAADRVHHEYLHLSQLLKGGGPLTAPPVTREIVLDLLPTFDLVWPREGTGLAIVWTNFFPAVFPRCGER
jgi:hypothetical protein